MLGKVISLISAIAVVYIAFVALVYFAQSRLVYFPTRAIVATPDKIGLLYEDVNLRTHGGR